MVDLRQNVDPACNPLIVKRATDWTTATAQITFFLILLLVAPPAQAAVGCSLNDPDRDIKKLFPESSGYRTTFVTIKDQGGTALYEKVQSKLGGQMDPVYESIDVPYAFYEVLKGKTVMGMVHGVNQKGTYGGMQIILATDLKGRIRNFYYQKISSPEAAKFTASSFTSQFAGLSLADFMANNVVAVDPSKSNRADFEATLRGIKKNLLILKELKSIGDAEHE